MRYRNFFPKIGLHPLAPPRDRLELIVSHPGVGRHWRVTIHEWRPDAEAYPGLPVSLEDAQARRRARMVVEVVEATDPVTALDPPSSAVTPCCLDLRRL